jgi:predicted RNA-binding protein associated with RNAse of E/G family
MPEIRVELHKPSKNQVVAYDGTVLARAPGYVLVRAPWTRPDLDLGYVVFARGDVFDEHFYADRAYAIFELRDAYGGCKGWYANIARPAVIGEHLVVSEDLELDLFVSPDRRTILRLDEDEFAARSIDAATRAMALAALGELETLARAGAPPFAQA